MTHLERLFLHLIRVQTKAFCLINLPSLTSNLEPLLFTAVVSSLLNLIPWLLFLRVDCLCTWHHLSIMWALAIWEITNLVSASSFSHTRVYSITLYIFIFFPTPTLSSLRGRSIITWRMGNTLIFSHQAWPWYGHQCLIFFFLGECYIAVLFFKSHSLYMIYVYSLFKNFYSL